MWDWIKKFIKEIKRVRFPSAQEANKTFLTSMIFIIIASLVLFGIAIGFTALWNRLGVGLNG